MKRRPKSVLAYSGGLDTSYSLVRYSKVENHEVHTVIVNTGGFSDNKVKEMEKRAYELGSSKHICVDVTEDYYSKCLKFLIFGNILKNNTYPLSVSAERTFQAIAIAHYVKKIGAEYIIHGSTGAGNDQVRFDVVFQLLCPEVTILTPVRDETLKREDEVDFLKQQGFETDWEKAKYSINKGIWGTSVGGAETLTSHLPLPENAFPSQPKLSEPKEINILFQHGEPVALNGQKTSPLSIIEQINDIGSQYAIGRDTHVGDTIIGIKGRVAFEAPAAIILIKAHHLLEKHVLTKWQLIQKEPIASWYGNLLHEAQYFDPVMRDFEAFLESSQKKVSGEVAIKLLPYRFELLGVISENDLMQKSEAKYGEESHDWKAVDVKGFIKICSNNLKNYFSNEKNI